MICSSIKVDKDPADIVDQLSLKRMHRKTKKAPAATEVVEYHDEASASANASSLFGNNYITPFAYHYPYNFLLILFYVFAVINIQTL
jgi:hypothetical protein